MSRKFSRVWSVAARYGVHKATCWRWSFDPRYQHLGFPRPYEIGPNTTAWLDQELDEYDARRMAEHAGQAE